MSRRAPYDFITEKLEQLPATDSQALWEQMQQQLDIVMPVKEDHRRRYMFFQLAASLMIMVSTSVIYLYKVRNADHHSITNESFTNTPAVTISTNHQQPQNLSNNKTSSIHTSNQLTYRGNHNQNQLLPPKQNRNTDPLVITTQVVASDYILLNKNESTSTEKQPEDINTLNHTVSAPEQFSTESDTRIRQIDAQHLPLFNYTGLDSVLEHSLVTSVATIKTRTHSKGWVAGVAMNFNLPVSHQEMSTVNMNGKENTLFDYLPSIFVQYHFSEKWYLSTELGWINPQYTPNISLFDHYTKVSNSQKQETEVNLNKLYYLNIPVSMHYRVAPHLYLGSGIEYSYLKRSILTNEQCMWEQQGSNWVMTKETKSVSVNASPNAVAKRNNANGNPSNIQPVDSIAESFRSSDWRVLMDVNYQYHRFVLGMNFAMGLTPYIKVQSGSGNGNIKDRNEAVQLYLHYNLFDKRK